jgi:peptidoglycan/LPS O-acetylase OafA/YrhL
MPEPAPRRAPPPPAPAPRVGAAPGATIPALDGLRGLAIAGVLACHFSNAWPGHAPLDRALAVGLGLGWAGVDLFFVLSGFLITGILLDGLHERGWWRRFLVRRSLRIFPVYYLALGLFGLFGPALGLIDPWTFGRWGWWYWTYLGNWAFAAQQVIPPLSHFWSLAVEEQFYLVWPLLVLVARRRLAAVCAALVLAGPALRAAIALGTSWPVGSAFRVTPGRVDALAAGALLAALVRSERGRTALRQTWPFAAGLGAALFVALGWPSGFDMHVATLEVWSQSALVLAFGGLLAGAVTAGAGRAWPRALSTAPLRALGRISYGLYVWHYFIHSGALRALRAHPAGAALLATRAGYAAYALAGSAASVGVAALSYQLVERRFLALKDRWAPRGE